MPRKPSLRWSREPHETGLARVVEVLRGYNLKYDGDIVAQLRPWFPGGFSRSYHGWYWYGGSERHGIDRFNEYSSDGPGWESGDLAEAKKFCRGVIAKKLAQAQKEQDNGN